MKYKMEESTIVKKRKMLRNPGYGKGAVYEENIWTPRYYVLAYEYAKAGLKKYDIARALGINPTLFVTWIHKYPELRWAIDRGKDLSKGSEALRNYYYNRLTPELKKAWDQIKTVRGAAAAGKIDKILTDKGCNDNARKELFIYALSACNFSVTRACRCVGISSEKLDNWSKDPAFGALVREMFQAKKDFMEEALVKLVAEGDVSAVIFANRTLNKDRGYGVQHDINVTGQVNHLHAVLDISKLDLPVDVQRVVLEAIRKKKAEGEQVTIDEKPANSDLPLGTNNHPSLLLAGLPRGKGNRLKDRRVE